MSKRRPPRPATGRAARDLVGKGRTKRSAQIVSDRSVLGLEDELVGTWSMSRPRRGRVGRFFRGGVGEVLEPLARGEEVFGLTKGKFSWRALIEALVELASPCSLRISTWRVGLRDVEAVARMKEAGEVAEIRWLLDSSIRRREPRYIEILLELFEDAEIRATDVHAKFAVIEALDGRHAYVLRGSANLNANRRLEYLEITDDAELAEFLRLVVDEVFSRQGVGAWRTQGRGAEVAEFRRFWLEHREQSRWGHELGALWGVSSDGGAA